MKKVIFKYILLSSIFLNWSINSKAQASKAYEMTVDGVKVIVQPVENNDIIEIQTILQGGVQNYPLSKQGIESLAMTALTECGTANYTKNQFKDQLDKVNGYIYANTSMNYATIRMNCINSDFSKVWPLYVEAIKKPAFNPKEFARIKQDAINTLKSNESDPDASLEQMVRKTAFPGKDYEKNPNGTEKTLESISLTETQNYYKSILEKSRMFIVIVGDLNKADIETYIHTLLAGIPQGNPFHLNKNMYNPTKNTFTSQTKENATNYIEGITSGPTPGSADYNAFQLAMRIFYDKHFLEVRTNNGLSYAPMAYFNGGATSSSAVYVTTTDPNKYIAVVRGLIQKVKKDGFSADELKNMKTTYLTTTYYKQETNSAQASSYASNQVLHGDWKRSNTLNADINKVSLEDVDKAFNKYINNMTWVYQGDTSKVNPKLYTLPNNLNTKKNNLKKATFDSKKLD
ncbi:M16 family metallopeptidase [Rhizosphaericola mali]|uniref:Insulinase family protein n=1 Tax=Rhizosphaericola mali TaxID=2545455 RepID=A0A5P2G2D3_9BACT|nr:pitrilysin family protein [Rhizosphaericola mali]QES87253.1 insulinase family protein [Rhizosphaericola mali]